MSSFLSGIKQQGSVKPWYLQRLDAALADVQEGRTAAEHPVEAALAEVEDLTSYCNDILATGAAAAAIRSDLADRPGQAYIC